MKLFSINGQDYVIQYFDSDNRHAVASIGKNSIAIKLPRHWPDTERQKAAERLERRIMKRLQKTKLLYPVPEIGDEEKKRMAHEALPRITGRMHELNAIHFRSPVGKIRIKGNLSNWGSCSPKNNISINFALLFLPEELLEYVIVHELAHTKIRNHSKHFWNLVEKAMPDYRQRKKELRKYLLTN
ncbi:MAG TPA: M48 family metallopeptidase [Candidatus Bilamarchaeaceae archaeon]|nr:M48 family metallopeptidase [Candidatus Bilamarchaeaceae archaeon]